MSSGLAFGVSLLTTLRQLYIPATVYTVLLLWIVYVLRFIGAWVAGCLTQTLLAAVLVHVMLCVSDIDYCSGSSRASFCASCTMWFRVEYLLSVVQAVLTWFVAPHWPLSALLTLGVGYETYVCLTQLERRTLDTVSVFRYKTVLVKETAWRVGLHVALFLLYLFYIGAFTILYLDPMQSPR